ncbi:hypothetical protein [Psychromonas sp. Urea-02u-13]|uniref:hypothetical protein n=1 Tax=Psychromonas sp. Urea-02u-13 TaxID=2058326 RepID=UPI0012FF29AF|nr:hypothetical protein [Psychromonas sp. Urea-02u-13]
MKPNKKLSAIVFLFCVFSKSLFAGVLAVNELSFGTVVVTDNSVVSTVSIDLLSGNTFVTNKMLVLVPGQLGEFLLYGLPPYTSVNLSANVITPQTTSGGVPSEQFTLGNLTVEPSLTIDENGEGIFFVGGTLSTSGNGNNNYADLEFTVRHNIVISY